MRYLVSTILSAAAALLCGGTAAAAGDHARFELLQLQPVAGADSSPVSSALVTFPATWDRGDAAAVVIIAGRHASPWRDRLIADLVFEGVATLELDVLGPRGLGHDSALAPDAPDPAAILPDLYAALRALRVTAGAGAVAVYGWDSDAGGAAALLAHDEAAAERAFGRDGPRFAAHVALGHGCRALIPGREPSGTWRREAIWRGRVLRATDPALAEELATHAAHACALAVLPGPGEGWPPAADDARLSGR